MDTSAERTFPVETPFGTVYVLATSAKHVHVSCDRNQPLTVNRVEWRPSFHMNDYGNGWEMSKENGVRQQWYLDRADFQAKSNWESERKAKDKIEATIPPLVAAALANKLSLLRSAELEGLRNRYASVSADVRELEKQLTTKRKELETICLASIAVESEGRQIIPVVTIPLSTEFPLVTP
jgi:hypothetical protein